MEVTPDTIHGLKGRVRVHVVMGGPSAEHAISLKSGQGVIEALQHRGWQAMPLVVPQELSEERAGQFVRRALQQQEADIAFLALHGLFGEDGSVQRICERLGVAYTGSDPRASALGLDKVASRNRFEQKGLRVPRWRLISAALLEHPDQILGALEFPVVVKPPNQGSSIGVSIAADAQHLKDAVECAAQYDARVILEEFVPGRELTVGILEDHALPVIEIQPAHPFFDFTAKYTPGQTTYLVPAPLDSRVATLVQLASVRAHQALGCRDMSRVDVILSESGEPVILEVNTIPGFTATSLLPKAAACIGLSYGALCERLVVLAAQRLSESLTALASSGGRDTDLPTPSSPLRLGDD